MPKSPWKCFICDEEAVGWEADYTFEDYGIPDRDGIVQTYGYYSRPNCVKAWMPLPKPYEVKEHD